MARKDDDGDGGDLERLAALLDEAVEKSPPRSGSAFDQVKALLPKIDALFAKRYTRAEVRDLLAKGGLEMSLGTFSQYYAKAKREAEDAGNGSDMVSEKKREPKVKADAKNTHKPSQLAGTSPGTTGEGKSNPSAHSLNDDA